MTNFGKLGYFLLQHLVTLLYWNSLSQQSVLTFFEVITFTKIMLTFALNFNYDEIKEAQVGLRS